MKRTGRQKDIVTPEKKQEQRELLRLFSANIRKILKNTDLLADDLQEIRLRTGAPLLVVAKDQEYFLTPDGALTGTVVLVEKKNRIYRFFLILKKCCKASIVLLILLYLVLLIKTPHL